MTKSRAIDIECVPAELTVLLRALGLKEQDRVAQNVSLIKTWERAV